jgi:hypothetical protein
MRSLPIYSHSSRTLTMTFSTSDINENDSPSQTKLKTNITSKYQTWKGLRLLNQGLDVSLTLSTIEQTSQRKQQIF